MKASIASLQTSFDPSSSKDLSRSSNPSSTLQNIWRRLTQLMGSRSEVRIWQITDQCGNLYWKVYDPVTNYSACFSSEAEVRTWLEQRYYQ